MYILGISALYHDSAAVLVKDGVILSAVQEERFTRKKHDMSVPYNAIRYCLEQEGITNNDLDAVVYYDNPILTLDRFLANLMVVGDDNVNCIERSYGEMFGNKIWIGHSLKHCIGGLGKEGELLVAKHHLSHAASAFYPSPFEHAAILTLDGVGEWNTTTIGYGADNKITLLKKIDFPHSIGLLYSAFTYFCGFKVNYGDYKLMGLAPYGEAVYYKKIKDYLIDIKEDGSFRLNLDYFDFQYGRGMTNSKFAELFGGNPREREGEITKREMDLAASVQKVIEEVVIKLAQTSRKLSGENDNLVLAGGVALNCVANGKLVKERIFKNIWVQPAAGDAGGALGCALLAYYEYFGQKRRRNTDMQQGSYLGPEYEEKDILIFLKKNKIPFERYDYNEVFYTKIAELLEQQYVIGLFEGRMEFGPRALGNRSIIADPRSENMQAKLNLNIKHRESFRPFAPAVIAERQNDYFDLEQQSPYMLICGEVRNKLDEGFSVHDYLETNNNLLKIINRKRSVIPAVTHVDYSARIQTVTKENNLIFYNIIKKFEEHTGCGAVINTSFNVRGEPIVCTPKDAFDCFMNTEMDVLIMNSYIIYKSHMPVEWRRRIDYEPD